MKHIIKTAILAVAAAVMIISCGNTGNPDKKKNQSDKKSSALVVELDATTFNNKVYDMTKDDMTYLGKKPAIVDFTASWCGPCRMIAPILEELAAEYGNKIVIYKVDIDKNQELAKAFKISSIPAILYIPTEGEAKLTVGSRSKDKFKTEIDSILLKK